MLPFPRFALEAPDTVAGAAALLAEPGSMPLAGGTDLLPSMKHRLFEPRLMVSTRRIKALREVTRTDASLRLGAGLTLREVARNADVLDAWPALAAACGTIATPTIQNMGTIGGNVMLDTRCLYYNQPAGWRASLGYCLKKEGTICHVAPKGKGCYAAHSADTVPALWLYGAELELVSAAGVRRVPLADFYGDDGRETAERTRGELLVALHLPRPSGVVGHRKARTRAAIDYGWLLVGVRKDPSGLSAVVSAVGPRPILVRGENPAALAEAAFAATQPLTTHLLPPPYRKKMVRVEVRRAAEAL